MAHIEGEKLTSERYNPNMNDSERNKSDENRILLCPTCHTKIDNDVEMYTVEKLREIKKEHENWYYESLKQQMPNITFAELEVIIKYLSNNPSALDNIKTLIPPKEKIKRNNLSTDVENLINIGMLKVKQVKEYMNENPDIQFSDRLRAGFVNEYELLKKEGLTEDDMFYELLNFACNNRTDFKYKAAGLSVLTYFFEICDVFEK